jgi:phosphoribosylglycinamide formyltransferase 1
MNLGILGSSGGGVLKAVFPALPRACGLRVLTDRPCGLETFAIEQGLRAVRIAEADDRSFARKALAWLQAEEVGAVLLFYTRILAPELHRELPLYNLHPSLLPAFSGFGALRQALEAGVRFIGATLHRVDETVDGGPILAQVCTPREPAWDLARLQEVSFVQKAYLALLWVEHLSGGDPDFKSGRAPSRAFPALETGAFLERVRVLQVEKGLELFP